MPLPFLFAIGVVVARIARVLASLWRDQEARGLLFLVLTIIATGTLFYRFVEGWTWIECLYFTVITLATVGYGDLSPSTDISRLFTIFYLLIGLGTLASFIGVVARHQTDQIKARVAKSQDTVSDPAIDDNNGNAP